MKYTDVITLLFLVFNSWTDLKKREISVFLTAVYVGAGLLNSIWLQRDILEVMLTIGIGLIILAFSIVTSGSIGMGDAWIILALGLMLSADIFMKTLCIGMLMAAVYAGILLMICKKGRRTEIAFIPFLLVGYMGGMLV